MTASLAAALLFTALLLSACTSTDRGAGGGQPSEPRNAAQDLAAGPPTLLYVKNGVLFTQEISSGKSEKIGVLLGDIAASPGSEWIASVESKVFTGESEDFVERPALYVSKPGDESSKVKLGPGYAPLFNADGSRVAYLGPAGARGCSGETCRGKSALMVASESSGWKPTQLMPPGKWTILGWAGDAVLAGDQADTSSTVMVAPDRKPVEIGLPPSDIWGASPDGRWLVTSRPGKAVIYELSNDGIGDERTKLQIDGLLGDGSWSHDSSRVAAVLRSASGMHMVTFSPQSSQVAPVPHTEGALAEVLWAPDNSGFAFTRVNRDNKTRLEADYCTLEDECRRVLSWTQGLAVLRIQ